MCSSPCKEQETIKINIPLFYYLRKQGRLYPEYYDCKRFPETEVVKERVSALLDKLRNKKGTK
jgi:hypothetical protein